MMDNELRERLNTIELKLDEIIRYVKPYHVQVTENKLWQQRQLELARQMNKPIGSK